MKKNEQKVFTYIKEEFSFTFTFPSNFTLVTEKFIDLLSLNFKKEEPALKKGFDIIFGGKCFIMKEQNKKKYSYVYITLYNEKKKSFNNEIDYFLKIKVQSEMKNTLNYLLVNNVWNFFDKINFKYNDEYKIIKNYKKEEIGIIVVVILI